MVYESKVIFFDKNLKNDCIKKRAEARFVIL